MRRPVAFALLLAGLLSASWARAASPPTFAIRLDRTQVGEGDTLIAEITLSVENGQVAGYKAPDFRGFRVLGEQPSQSTQVQMGGGGTYMRQVYGWRYQLLAEKQGTFSIGAARVRVAGQELHTDPVTVTVAEAGQGAPAQRRGAARGLPGGIPNPGLPFPGFGNLGGDEPTDQSARTGGSHNFLRVVPNKRKAYVGEQVTVEWYLYLTERQDKYATTTEPHTDGFWAEDLIAPNQRAGLQLTEQAYEGRTYLVAPLMRKALFPLHAGRLTVTPLEAEISRVDFFGATLRTERLKTEPLVIEVQPLPTAGQPPKFDSSAVGRLAISAAVDRDHVAVGEAVTLKMLISGQGNLRKLPTPALPHLEGWKAYEPKVSVALEQNDLIGGTKQIECLLLPEKPGSTVIPPLTLPFFDPQRASYVVEKTAPIRIEVSGDGATAGAHPSVPGAPTASGLHAAPGGENILSLNVRPLHSRPTLHRDLGTSFYRSRGLAAVVAVPPLALALTAFISFVRERLSQETEGARRRKLRRLARRRLRTAEHHLSEGRLAQSFGEIERVLREFLSGKLGMQVAGLSSEELRKVLIEAGVAAALADACISGLEDCDRARFAPGSVSAEEVRVALDQASDVILQMEKTALRPVTGGNS